MTGWTLPKFEKLFAYSKYLHHCHVTEAVCVCAFFVVLIHSRRTQCAFYCYCGNCVFGRLLLCFARRFRLSLSLSLCLRHSVSFLLTHCFVLYPCCQLLYCFTTFGRVSVFPLLPLRYNLIANVIARIDESDSSKYFFIDNWSGVSGIFDQRVWRGVVDERCRWQGNFTRVCRFPSTPYDPHRQRQRNVLHVIQTWCEDSCVSPWWVWMLIRQNFNAL